MIPRVSVHIVAKENTPLGRLFFSCCLQALLDSSWPDEIIIVDDGCARHVVDMYQNFITLFKEKGVRVKAAQAENIVTYAGLRNKALSMTDPYASVFHWIDTDEVYFSKQLDALKQDLERVPDFRQAYTYFYHFIINPMQWQDKCTKDNIFRFAPSLKWERDVHEKLTGLVGTASVQTNVQYLHLGYCRPQWQTCLKWLHYDMVEHGNVDRYKDERYEDENGDVKTKPWLYDGHTPDMILDDRKPICEKNGIWDINNIPKAAIPIYEHAHEWNQFLQRTEDYSFWHNWVEMAQTAGSWRDTLERIVEKMLACGWSYDGKKTER